MPLLVGVGSWYSCSAPGVIGEQWSGDAISTILKKSASGGDQFFVRKAQVIGLGELLFFFGEKFTAGEFYAYFVNARKLTCKRPRARVNPERWQQLLLLWQTNTWGWPVRQQASRETRDRPEMLEVGQWSRSSGSKSSFL